MEPRIWSDKVQQSEEKVKGMVNGVDVERLTATIEAIKEQPEIANFKFRAINRWVTGANSRTVLNEYGGACQRFNRKVPFVLQNDEPPILLGNDMGPSPAEYVLAALSGCLTTSLVYHASVQGIRIDEIESTYEGDIDIHGFLGMDENVRNGFENIRITFKVKGDASDEKLQELIELAQKRSSLFDIFTNKVPVSVQLA
jgi:uncharacterized OsmC-like protein